MLWAVFFYFIKISSLSCCERKQNRCVIGGPLAKYSGVLENLPVTTLLKSAFLVSIQCQHLMVAFTTSSSNHYSLSHTLCALDARFLHSFSFCCQDGDSLTFKEVDRWCLPSLFRKEQLVVH